MADQNLSDGNTVLIAMSEAIGDLSGVWVGWIRNRYLPSTDEVIYGADDVQLWNKFL